MSISLSTVANDVEFRSRSNDVESQSRSDDVERQSNSKEIETHSRSTHVAIRSRTSDVKVHSESNEMTQTKSQKPMSDYDVSSMMAILQAHSIFEGIPEKDLNSEFPHSKAYISVYYYEPLKFNKDNLDCLLRDQLNYFLKHQNHPNRLNQRRFAVLCQMDNGKIYALILQLSKFNQEQAQILKKELQEKLKSDSLHSSASTYTSESSNSNSSCSAESTYSNSNNSNNVVENFLKDQKLVTQLKKLYEKIECFWIGCEKDGVEGIEVQALLKLALKQAFSLIRGVTIQVHINNLPEGPRHILLTEHITKMILNGKAPEYPHTHISPQQLALIKLIKKQHIEVLKVDFSKRLCDLSPPLKLQIKKNLIKLHKFSLLIKMRQKIVILPTNSVNDIEGILIKDANHKINIYKNDDILYDALRNFPHSFVMQMVLNLKNSTTQTNLLNDLKNRNKTYLKKIQQWETNLNEEIAKRLPRLRTAWFKHYGKKTIAFLYNSTLVQLGGSLLHWATKSCRKRFINKNTPLHLTISATRKFTKWAIQKQVLQTEQCNSEQSKRINQWIDHCISPGGLVYLIGAGIGAWMTSGCSYYSMLRQVALILLGQKIYTGLQNNRIDEENAEYSDQYKDIKSIHCSFLAQVLITMTEFHFTGDIRYVFSAVGSSGTGLASVLILCKYLPELDRPASLALAEDAAHIKFIFHLAGSNIGYMAASNVIETVDFHIEGYQARYQERLYLRSLFNDTLQQLLKNGIMTEVEMVLPDMVQPRISLSSPNTTFLGIRYPELSLLSNKPIFLGWRFRNDPMYYQTQCELNTRLDTESLRPANAMVLAEESEPIVYCLPPSRSFVKKAWQNG